MTTWPLPADALGTNGSTAVAAATATRARDKRTTASGYVGCLPSSTARTAFLPRSIPVSAASLNPSREGGRVSP
jgi:hypothetical protein